ncbi:MAG: PAS domain S-box protein, partial [Bdellovibrionales bacterium]|nr:PAS domain S-box protein [Bdellovibrionales bacterium]
MSTIEDFKDEFFALSPDIIGLVRLDGYFSYVSPAVTEVLGYSTEEFISRPLMSYVHPEDVDSLLDEYQHFATGKKVFSITNRCKHKDGSYRYLTWKSNPNIKNKLICTIGRDITDVMRAQEELKRFFNLALDFMCMIDFEGKFLQVNPSFSRELGYINGEILNVPVVQFIHPDDISSTLNELQKLYQGIATLQFENRFRHKNGQYRTFSWKAYPSPEENKIYATARDITELRKAKSTLEIKVQERTEELSKSRAFLNSLIENLPNMVFVKEAENLTFIRFNKAGEELLGYKVSDLYGKNDYDFFPKEQADFFTSRDRKVLSGKSIVNIPEEEIETKYKGTRILHTKKIPIYNSEGNAEYLLGISEDITELKMAERERFKLIQNQTIMEERERISKREGFLAEMSNILASSLNFREVLSKLASVVLPQIADWGIISIVNESGKIERISSVHPDEQQNSSLKELVRKLPAHPVNEMLFLESIKKRKSYFLPIVTPQMQKKLISDKSLIKLMNKLGCYSVIIVPITNRDNTLGNITFVSTSPLKRFSQEDLSMAEDIGKRAGLALENALLYATARQAIQSRDDFISIASHELKTPITSLKLQLQMTKRSIHVDTGETPSAGKL